MTAPSTPEGETVSEAVKASSAVSGSEIKQVLGDKEWGLRRAAAVALGNAATQSQDVEEALRKAAEDEHEGVQKAAQASLSKLGF